MSRLRLPRTIAVVPWGMALGILLVASPRAEAKPGYLRWPNLNANRVVFSAEGDLWLADLDGSEARRLTTHPGTEGPALFSPDGKWIAFSGDYDGNRDLYVMPAEGGEPRRLTWHPAPDEPLCWSGDGKDIYFRSNRDHPHHQGELYRVPAGGGDPQAIKMGSVVTLDIDRESGQWAFTRLGGGGTWKRYRGGTAPDIWVGDPTRADYKKVTDFDGLDTAPMWYKGRIFFLCDQGGTANLWSMLPDGSDRRSLTDLGQWDARAPSSDGSGRFVFVVAGDIHLYNAADGTEHALKIDLPSERILTRTRYPDASRYMTEYALAPEGDRVAVTTRGEVFSVAAKDGVTIPVTRGSGARESRVSYDPEGKRLVYVTDESGEEQIVTADAWGRGQIKQVTAPGTSAWHFAPLWSPDGKWIAYADQSHALYLVPATGGDPVKIDFCERSEIGDYCWSPDGRWLAYSKSNSIEWSSLFIYDTKDKMARQVTTWSTNDRNPAWDPDGRYLSFLSDRIVSPVFDWRRFETILLKTTKPYLLLLRPEVENPFAHTKGLPPKEGEGKAKKEEKAEQTKDKTGVKQDKEKEEKPEKPKPVEITFEGLADRVVEVPVEAGTYYGLSATAKKLFYIEVPPTGVSDDPVPEGDESGQVLWTYDLEAKEAKTFLDGVGSYDLQARAGKIAVKKGQNEIYILDADSPPGDDMDKKKVSLDDLVVELNPLDEWRQMYAEAWRDMRDFYWDQGMHGVDWTALRDQYATLLPRIAERDELRDLMAELVGELATSHTYVWGGDRGVSVPQIATGLLGATVSRVKDGFRVDRIFRGDPADRICSSLREPGVDVREGDVILSVNNQSFSPAEPFEARLEGLAGKDVVLSVARADAPQGPRAVVVKAMAPEAEANLRYADWVRRNREYVSEKTGGRIAYIHLPDMGGRGLREFDTWFFPQLDKEGMVVDARWNGGGFVSQLIVSRLLRHLLWWDRARWGGVDTYPANILNGPFVVLTNENAGSDGDIFPAAIQTAKAAPVIGKRSWGGVIGLRGFRSLVDQGLVTQPEVAFWSPSKGWGIENHGVDPDIEVENLPQDLGRGVDAQLDRGIEEVLRLQKDHPPLKPEFAPSPDRSRGSYAKEK
jgi:tricorn protease